MSQTNFGSLTTEQKGVWSRDLWSQVRNYSFIEKFMGTSQMSVIQRITELTPTERGDRAIVTLVADIEGDGVVGDKVLEGKEAPINAYDATVNIDQMRNGNRHEGRLAHQKSVVNFREQSKDKLAYWLADRRDQLAILTMSGVAYTFTNKGGTRPVLGGGVNGQNFSELEFAADVVAPSAGRHFYWDGAADILAPGDTSAVAAGDKLSYATIVSLKQQAKDDGLRGVKQKDGLEEQYHLIVTPKDMRNLELDPDFLANQRDAGMRGESNRLFKGGSSVLVNGVWVHEFRHVFNTVDAVSGVGKWGAGSNVDGSRLLFCGAQALAVADITMPNWVEKGFDYDNQQGIAIDQITGMLKPQFKTPYIGGGAVIQDHGIIVCDVTHG
jgi:N4-gp56 family major capsid protein